MANETIGSPIFAGLTPDGHSRSIEAAVAAIVARAQERNLIGGAQQDHWSLAELSVTAADYVWLQSWIGAVNGAVLRTWLRDHGFRGLSGIGLMLLLLSSETARRDASGDALWPAIAQLNMASTTRSVLFVPGQSQPTRLFKDSIEAAAQGFYLRHVFGVSGLQNWFDSVRLQFGFSRPSFRARLPEWLIGAGQPHAVDTLLSGPLQSNSFTALWEALRLFRRGNWSEHQLRDVLEHNPWVLSTWHDELIAGALARREELGVDTPAKRSPLERIDTLEQDGGREDALADDTAPDAPPFLSGPFFVWQPGLAPQWRCSIMNLAHLDLPAPHYDLEVNGVVRARLLRTADGRLTGPDDIVAPFEPLLVATLRDSSGNEHSGLLKGWDVEDDVVAFTLSDGRPCDVWQSTLDPKRELALLTSADLRVEPEPAQWMRLADRWTMWHLPAGWNTSLEVWLDDELLWSPRLKGGELSAPPWEPVITCKVRGAAVSGQPITIEIEHPPAVEVTFVRHEGAPVQFKRTSASRTLAGPVALPIGASPWRTVMRLGLREGNHRSTGRYSVEVPVAGAFRLNDSGWELLDPAKMLSVRAARERTYMILPPREDEATSVPGTSALMEGDTFLRRLSSRPGPLGDLAGLGAPLTVRAGVYNAPGEGLRLTSGVYDTGVLRQADSAVDKGRRCLRVGLTQAIEPDPSHHLLWWDGVGTLFTLVPETAAATVEGPRWQAALPETATKLLGAAVSYEGVRLGAIWANQWSAHLNRLSQAPQANAEWAERVAFLLRWFKLPVLSEAHLANVRQLARRFPVAFLRCWVGETPPHANDGLVLSGNDEAWIGAARAVFGDWDVDTTQAHAIVAGLGFPDADPHEQLRDALRQLQRATPEFMARVARAWLKLPPAELGATKRGAWLEEFIRDLYSAAFESQGRRSQREREDDLVQSCAWAMRVAEGFVRDGLLRPAVAHWSGHAPLFRFDAHNITLATSIEPFRRLLAGALLRHVADNFVR